MARRSGKSKKRRTLRRPAFTTFRVTVGIIIAAAVVLGLLYSGVLKDRFGLKPYKEPAAPDADTSVRFIDVGQGDCTLAVSEGVSLLIDSGELDEHDRVITYLEALGIRKLDYIIVTHPHSDHMGEMSDIIDRFGAGEFIMPRLPDELVPTTYSYEKMLRSLAAKGIRITASEDSTFTAGGFTVELFTPTAVSDNLNNCSTVVKLTHGGNSFLITGDCEREEEQQLILKGCGLSADVLKVGHHGSATSSSAELLAAVRPVYAVISCSADNAYGHPADSTLLRLKAAAREVLMTFRSGTVTFVSDGKGLSVYTDKEEK